MAGMPDSAKLRDLVSHRVAFEYDSGARVVGYLAGCKPATGPVQVVCLSKATIADASGQVVESHDALSLVPAALLGVHAAEGPRGREG
jgi:hypothetical protein